MWSLPNIVAMNSEKHEQQRKFKRALKTGRMDGKKIPCDREDEHCDGEVFVEPYYDIFSDDIGGLFAQCEYHRDREGTPEGYFFCDGCSRTMIENITWELYYHCDDGGMLCLPCYAERELAEESNWIPLTDAAIDAVNEKTIRKAKHLIGVEMPVPKGIRFVNNVEYDSYNGQSISGGGADELKDTLRQLKDEGEDRAILVLDAAYQFAVSIAVYAETPEARDERRAEARTTVLA